MAKRNIFQQIYHAPDRRKRVHQEWIKNRNMFLRLFDLYPHPRSRQFLTLEWGGLTLLLDKTSTVDHHIIDRGSWEAEQLAAMMAQIDACKDKSACMFLDIGAYWGLYSLMAAKHGISDIHLFEPDPRNRSQLNAQLFLNNKHAAFHVHPFAASDHAGELFFRRSETITSQNRGMAGITDKQEAGGFTVQCRPIDDVITQSDRTVFCKIDVEGAEIQVLSGMENLIRNNRVFLQVEVFEDNLDAARACAARLGLTFKSRIDCDDYYSNH